MLLYKYLNKNTPSRNELYLTKIMFGELTFQFSEMVTFCKCVQHELSGHILIGLFHLQNLSDMKK